MEWNNAQDPNKGFKYLYLTDTDYQAISNRSLKAVVKATTITEKGDFREPDRAVWFRICPCSESSEHPAGAGKEPAAVSGFLRMQASSAGC